MALQRQPYQTRGMDLSRMTAEQVHELMRLLAEMEQEEMELLVRECMKAKRVERLHSCAALSRFSKVSGTANRFVRSEFTVISSPECGNTGAPLRHLRVAIAMGPAMTDRYGSLAR